MVVLGPLFRTPTIQGQFQNVHRIGFDGGYQKIKKSNILFFNIFPKLIFFLIFSKSFKFGFILNIGNLIHN